MQQLNLENVEETDIIQKLHRFGNYDEEQPSLFWVEMPFSVRDVKGKEFVGFDIAFDLIEGDLPFLLGLQSLRPIVSTLNHIFRTLALTMNRKFHHLQK